MHLCDDNGVHYGRVLCHKGAKDEVSGIGLLTASALKTAVGKPERFANGRQLSAWLGMTPREFSSGDRRKLGHISRQGNVYVRTLLIHGARAALRAAQQCQARTPEKLTQLQRWQSRQQPESVTTKRPLPWPTN